MLGKLLKYDFKSIWKQFAIVWPASIVLAAAARLSLGHMVYEVSELSTADQVIYTTRADRLSTTMALVSILALVGVVIAMFVIAMVFGIRRFYRGLLGDEGYLNHTLPVGTWQLIVSKLLCAVAVTAVSALVTALSLTILLWGIFDFEAVFHMNLRGLIRLLSDAAGGHLWLYLLELVIMMLAGCFQAYLQFYAAMALGHLARQDRVALSVAAYVILNIALSLIMNLVGALAVLPDPAAVGLIGGVDGPTAAAVSGGGHTFFIFMIVWYLIWSAVFFLITHTVLKRKLNLE